MPEPLAPGLLALLGGEVAPTESLEDALQSAWSEGSDAWPQLQVARDRWLGWIAARIDASADPTPQVRRLLARDGFLACACETGDENAIAAFRTAFADVLQRAFAGARTRGQDATDLEQRLLIHLFASDRGGPGRIATYGGTGALRTWVRATATRLRIDSERRLGNRDESLDEPGRLVAAEALREPELEFLDLHHRDACREAMRRAFAQLEPRQRNVLRLHLLDGLGGTEIAKLHGVDRATAKRWIARARAQMVANTQDQLVELLGIDRDRLESVLAAVRSHIDISVRMFLTDARPVV